MAQNNQLKIGTNPYSESEIFSYEKVEEKNIIHVIYQGDSKKVDDEVIYSEHNCGVLDRRIEKSIFELETNSLKKYEQVKKINIVYIMGLVFLDFLFLGDIDMLMIFCNLYAFSKAIKSLQIAKNYYLSAQHRMKLIQLLKENLVELTNEELELLNDQEKELYQKSGKITIANMNAICNQKVLKKRFGKPNGKGSLHTHSLL